jgi:hypothetical protein
MKPIKCCGCYCCVFIPPEEPEYPNKKLKKDFSIKFDEVLEKQRIESSNNFIKDLNIKIVKTETIKEKNE